MIDKIVGPIKPIGPQPGKSIKRNASGLSFDELLKESLEKGLKFSAHAIERLHTRGISPNELVISRLNRAVEQAKNKGVRDCLVLLDDTAYLVSIKNQTVVTAIGKDELKERIFTSIDSVVIG